MNYSISYKIHRYNKSTGFLLASILFFFVSCKNEVKQEPVFEVLSKENTGLDFTNKLTPTPAFNMFKYMYFYNGAGVGAGDFNNDGLVDLFFASNQGESKLFINKGGLHFEDVTTKASIPKDGGWSTGVSVVDINNDGMLDIYLCRVGNFENLKSHNLLLICTSITTEGVPVYKEVSKEYGLDFSGFSTQAAFFDYDLDGDLDMYLLNHSLRFNGTFAERQSYSNTYDSLAGDRFYRNDNGQFSNITKSCGINSSIIGYGLGIAISDIDLDGDMDIVAGNFGLNNKFQISRDFPAKMIAGDFDENGSVDPILAYHIANAAGDKTLFPAVTLGRLSEQIPKVKKIYLSNHDYSLATLDDLIKGLDGKISLELKCAETRSGWFENQNANFLFHPFPDIAQFSTVNTVVTEDIDKDGRVDLILGGNNYQMGVDLGIQDASIGLLMMNRGNSNWLPFDFEDSGLLMPGDVRDSKVIKLGDGMKLLLTIVNNDSLQVMKIKHDTTKK